MVKKKIFTLSRYFEKMIDPGKSSQQIIILILLSALFFTGSLFTGRDFWVEDEARYAEVLREMIEENQWLVPHLDGHYYPDKPPLYFWTAALFSLVTGGITPLSFLLINWLSALGLILATYFFGRYLFNSFAGFLSALILMSSMLFTAAAQVVRMDMMFALFITLAIFFFYRGTMADGVKGRYYCLCYLFSALAVLTKGPFGFVFVFLPAVIFLLRGRSIRAFFINPGLLLFIILVCGWLVLAAVTGHDDFVKNIFSKQILGRAVDSFHHKEPFYYYLLALPPLFLPWFPFLPRAIKRGWQRRREGPFMLLFLWFIPGFLVISIVSCKLFIYLLPLLPPLALFSGYFLSEWIKQNGFTGKSLVIMGLTSVLLTFGILAAAPLVSGYPSPPYTVLFLCLVIAGICITFLKKFKALLMLLFSGMALFSLLTIIIFAPRLNSDYSPRPISEHIRRYAEQDYRVGAFRVTRGILSFYAHHDIEELARKDLPAFLNSPQKKLLIIKARDIKRLKKKFPKSTPGSSEVGKHIFKLNNEQYILVPLTGVNQEKEEGGPVL